jgi:hypothetical protein
VSAHHIPATQAVGFVLGFIGLKMILDFGGVHIDTGVRPSSAHRKDCSSMLSITCDDFFVSALLRCR